MKLPRKLKKLFNKLYIGEKTQQNFNWVFHKRMVIIHNYVLGEIPIKLTKQDETFIRNGLLVNPKFKVPYGEVRNTKRR